MTGPLFTGEWFVVPSGKHEGRAHMGGWQLSAKLVNDERETGGTAWWSIAHCPRCLAVVSADEDDAYGDLTWAHERWHAATDYPIPPEILDRVTRP